MFRVSPDDQDLFCVAEVGQGFDETGCKVSSSTDPKVISLVTRYTWQMVSPSSCEMGNIKIPHQWWLGWRHLVGDLWLIIYSVVQWCPRDSYLYFSPVIWGHPLPILRWLASLDCLNYLFWETFIYSNSEILRYQVQKSCRLCRQPSDNHFQLTSYTCELALPPFWYSIVNLQYRKNIKWKHSTLVWRKDRLFIP